MEWHVELNGQRYGPVPQDELVEWARIGRLRPFDPVWRPGMPGWAIASQVPELRSAVPGWAVPTQELGEDRLMRALLPVGRSGWAIAAGYLGIFALLAVPAPFALLAGLLAMRDIRRNPKKHGMGRAVFAIVMGAIGTLVLAFFLFAAKTNR